MTETAVSSPMRVVEEVVEVPLGLIDDTERLRPIDQDWAETLAALMAREGQRQPIELYRIEGSELLRLGPGGHRLAAARLLEWPTIQAVIKAGSAILSREAEVAENLFRLNLNPLDRAAHIAELVALAKARAGVGADEDGRRASANARWNKVLKQEADDASVTMTHAFGWADEVAGRVGFSRETIYRDLLLFRRLPPDVATAVRDTAIGGNAGQLRALAKLDEADQRKAIKLITEGRAKTTGEAVAFLQKRVKPTPQAKAWSAVIGNWSRLSAQLKREALRELAKIGLPRGVRITFDDETDGGDGR